MRICVVGSGYVGLVTGACLADFGMDVVCVDQDEAKIAQLQTGRIPIYEPGLSTLVAKNEEAGRLSFTTALAPALESAAAVFIAVGTPPREDGSSDLRYVRDVTQAIAGQLSSYKAIVTKSTVPVGTGRMIEEIVGSGRCRSFSVVSNPEFLREGSAIEDFMRPDRLVIGSRDQRATDIMLEIYSPLRARGVPIVVTDVETAEMIKYASNSFLATRISFINEVAELCERTGADVQVVARGMGLDRRIGPLFLRPGPGFGGSCFPKDTRAMVSMAREAGARTEIVEATLDVNRRVQDRMLHKIESVLGDPQGRTVALLGLSFKPDTDDIRESPALFVLDQLLARGANVRAYDPAAMDNARRVRPEATYCGDQYEAADGAELLVILTEWNQFRALEFVRLRGLLREPRIVDLRNLYDPQRVAAAGLHYYSLGRADAVPDDAGITDDGQPQPVPLAVGTVQGREAS